MKTFAAVATLGAVASATLMQKLDYDFMRFVSAHNKMYGTVEEFDLRKSLYAEVDAFVQEANSKDSSYRAAHNKFSDWTQQEKDNLLGLKNMPVTLMDDEVVEAEAPINTTTKNWCDEGACTPVKDQGSCGSCWAFSSIEAIESAWKIAGNDLVVMSEQELVDCSSSTGNEGCNGGWYFWSYDWLKTNKTMKEADYPYTARDGSCQYNADKGITNVPSYGQTKNTGDNLARLAQQPVNVAVAAGNNVFMNYSSGIITVDDGCPTSIDHAIVAVGWGSENGVQYYIVRNSWGTGWGEGGFVRIQTSTGRGVCGINQYVFYPNV